MTDQPGNTPADDEPRPDSPADQQRVPEGPGPGQPREPEGPGPSEQRTPEGPGPYQGVFGSPGQPGPTAPGAPGSNPPPADRPGPYAGSFGQPNAPANQPKAPFGFPGTGFGQSGGSSTPPGSTFNPGNHPPAGFGPPGTPFPRQPSPYAYQPITPAPPKQVTIAAAIAFGIGGLSVLLGLFSLTSAGEQISEILTGSPDSQGVVVVAILISSVAYILPAIFVRKRRPWARTMLIVVAAIGIAGGLMALPGSILGLAIHATLLILLLQQPTKLWFQHR